MKVFLFLLISSLCSSLSAQTKEIDRLMNRYDQFILRGAYDSIANMFDVSGQLQGENQSPIVGREAIRRLLKSFAGATVLKYETFSKGTSFDADTAIQSGSYVQIVRVPSGDTLHLGGQYKFTWSKENNDHWMIKNIYTYDYRNLKDEKK